MLKAWRAYRSLNEAQKEIIEQKQIKLNRPIDETIETLKGIADMDQHMTWSAGGVGCTMVLAVIIGFFGSMIGNGMGLPGPVITLWLIICAGFFLVPFILYRSTRGIDVSDNLRVSALPILYVFRDDIDPQQPVELTLDLRQPMAKEKLLREVEPREKTKEKYYSDPWMAAAAVLVDGTRLRWSVTDTIRHRSVTKRGRSGKWKTKTKESKKCDIDVAVTVKNKAYEVQGGEAGEKKTTLTASKTIKLADVKPVDPKVIIEVIASLFQRVSPAK